MECLIGVIDSCDDNPMLAWTICVHADDSLVAEGGVMISDFLTCSPHIVSVGNLRCLEGDSQRSIQAHESLAAFGLKNTYG